MSRSRLLPVLVLFFGLGMTADATGLLGDGTFIPAFILAGLGVGVLVVAKWSEATFVGGIWLLAAAILNAVRHAGFATLDFTTGVAIALLGALMLLAPHVVARAEPLESEAAAASPSVSGTR